ncbi:UNVERIFIED_ORG: hypothetical protein QFZ59_002643 [Bacillus sp. B2I3]|nr:hypothetical protein [Bacillus sp. B2I3]
METKEKNVIPSEDLKRYQENINSTTDKNAFYWYVMNLVALSTAEEVDFFLDYSKIINIEEIAEQLNLLDADSCSITHEIFNGDRIYSDSIFVSLEPEELKQINEEKYSIGTIDKIIIGSSIQKNNSNGRNIIEENKVLYNNELYEHFNEDIKKKLSRVFEKGQNKK